MSKTLEICTLIGQPIIEQAGYELVDLEYVKEGRDYVLRYYIDRPDGVDIDDCAQISEQISLALDREDPIAHEYILEISSPGAERPLKTMEDIKKAIGKYVHVKLYAPIAKMKEIEGNLVAFADETLTIEYMEKTAKKTIAIPYRQVAKIRLAIKF